MNAPITPSFNTRLGIHYFQDTFHYRESDLHRWLPELKSLGVTWISLVAPLDRAIPESFLTGLLKEGIEPVLHFHLPLEISAKNESLSLLFHTYATWGLHYAVLFDRPNARSSWPDYAWAQSELVERFLDIFLPLAESARQAGLTPVFPPLEPGGDYWDTAFLRAALQSIQRRRHSELLEALVLSAYADTANRPLDWGAGGPERWPGARPYFTPPGQQDQRGFYIFDWYLTLAQAVLEETPPILLFGAGRLPAPETRPEASGTASVGRAVEERAAVEHTEKILTLAHLLAGQAQEETGAQGNENHQPRQAGELDPVPAEVLSCSFWLLSDEAGGRHASQAWFQPDGSTLPVVGRLRDWAAEQPLRSGRPIKQLAAAPIHSESQARAASQAKAAVQAGAPAGHPIAHYLLLPSYPWGIADWHLEVIRPFVKKHRPTVGFSLEEAALAARVTVVGGEQLFSNADIERLSRAGCSVERIDGDGTSIATQLANR